MRSEPLRRKSWLHPPPGPQPKEGSGKGHNTTKSSPEHPDRVMGNLRAFRLLFDLITKHTKMWGARSPALPPAAQQALPTPRGQLVRPSHLTWALWGQQSMQCRSWGPMGPVKIERGQGQVPRNKQAGTPEPARPGALCSPRFPLSVEPNKSALPCTLLLSWEGERGKKRNTKRQNRY